MNDFPDNTPDPITLDQVSAMIDARLATALPDYMKSTGFTDRWITDTPTDALQVVNRKYITSNGTVAARPTSPVVGQPYLATDTNIPMTYTASGWVNGVASIVAST